MTDQLAGTNATSRPTDSAGIADSTAAIAFFGEDTSAKTTLFECDDPPAARRWSFGPLGGAAAGVGVVIIVLGIGFCGTRARSTEAATGSSAPAPIAMPHSALDAAPAPTPTPKPAVGVAQVRPAKGRTPRWSVPITTVPQGASVSLIVDGSVRLVGRTPLVVPFDASRTSDVVVALRGYKTQVRRLDRRTRPLSLTLAIAGR